MPEVNKLTEINDLSWMAAAPFLEGLSRVIDVQSDVIRRMEEFSAGFLQRRREGCIVSKELMDQIRASSSMTDVLMAQQKWVAGSAGRIMADMVGWQMLGFGAFDEKKEPSRSDMRESPIQTSRVERAARAAE